MDKLFLEVPSEEREQEAFEYIDEHIENDSDIVGCHGLSRFRGRYKDWLRKVEMDSIPELCTEEIPSRVFFLVRESDNRIVGMLHIYLGLNDRLRDFGGNIGYGIRPTERGKGYNNINLLLGLLVCRDYHMDQVLLTAFKDNKASVRTMENFGGVKIKDYFDEDEDKDIVHYVIDVNQGINSNIDRYKEYIVGEEFRKVI